jgi:hypothetical protein
MSDIETQASDEVATSDNGAVDPSAAISRGKGKSLQAIEEGSDEAAKTALAEFRDLVERHKVAEAEAEALKLERNAMVRTLKDEHDVGFSAQAEVIGATSSLVLYLYERAAGKSAKQIREESKASAAAKAQMRVDDPDRKPARKQTPEERSFRKQQREALKAFLEEQAKLAQERGDGDDENQAALAELEAEEAADAAYEEDA